MLRSKFDKLVEEYLGKQCKDVLVSKGREYQNAEGKDEDVLANFKRTGKAVNIPMDKVLRIFQAKHRDSIMTFWRDIDDGKSISEIEKNLSEPIEGRIVDIINYYMLMIAMINEIRENEQKESMLNQEVDAFSSAIIRSIHAPGGPIREIDNVKYEQPQPYVKYRKPGEKIVEPTFPTENSNDLDIEV